MPTTAAETNVRCDSSSDLLADIVRMSHEFFSGPMTVETMSDPDAPGESWTVLNVEASGNLQEIIQAQCQWHERLAEQFPDAVSNVRLSIDPQS